MENINEFNILNNTYLKYVSDGLLELKNDKLVLDTLNEETVIKIFEYVKLNNKNTIIMTNKKINKSSWFHLHFDTENEMLIYNIFI